MSDWRLGLGFPFGLFSGDPQIQLQGMAQQQAQLHLQQGSLVAQYIPTPLQQLLQAQAMAQTPSISLDHEETLEEELNRMYPGCVVVAISRESIFKAAWLWFLKLILKMLG